MVPPLFSEEYSLSLPPDYEDRMVPVPTLSIQPHSTHLSKICLEDLKRRTINNQEMPPPLVIKLNEYSLTLDGDHRVHNSYLNGEESIFVAEYSLSNKDDFRIIRRFESERNEVLSNLSDEEYLDSLLNMIRFVRWSGIEDTGDFKLKRRYLSSRWDIDLAYQMNYGEFLREQRREQRGGF